MDEIRFKNTSKLDVEEISIFQSVALKKSNLLMSIIFTLVFVGAGVGAAFWDLTMGIILIICGLAAGIFFLPYLLKENYKKANINMLGDKKYLSTFEFYNDHLFARSEVAESDKKDYKEAGTQTIDYSSLHKVMVFKNKMYIFINQQQAFILDYKGMLLGTAGELVEFLKKCGVKIVDKSNEELVLSKKK